MPISISKSVSIYIFIHIYIYYFSLSPFLSPSLGLHFLPVYLSTCLCVDLSWSIYLFIYLSIDLSIYRSIDLSIYLSIYRSIYLSVDLCIYPSFNRSIFLYIYLSTFLSAACKKKHVSAKFLWNSEKISEGFKIEWRRLARRAIALQLSFRDILDVQYEISIVVSLC